MADRSEARVREEMAQLARSLFERGLTPGSSGNLSARTSDGGFLMTPTNASLGDLDPSKLAKLDENGCHVSGDKPTKEAFLHLAFYRKQPRCEAVTHLHSTYCVCLSCLADNDPDNMVPALTPYVQMRVGRVARVPYFRPGDPRLGGEIEKLALRYNGVIIANHGPVVSGKSLRDSVFAMEELEEAAKIAILTRGLPVDPLTGAQIEDLEKISLR